MTGKQSSSLFDLMRVVRAFRYSAQGIAAAFRSEAAFRQELVVALVLAPLGFWLGNTGVERALLVGTLLLVLIVEILNSAIEAVVDRFGGELHDLSGQAKDMGSAAVLLSIGLAMLVWLLILF